MVEKFLVEDQIICFAYGGLPASYSLQCLFGAGRSGQDRGNWEHGDEQ